MSGGVFGSAAKAVDPPKRKPLKKKSGGRVIATGSGKAGVGVKKTVRAPLKKRRSLLSRVLGAGVDQASKSPIGGGSPVQTSGVSSRGTSGVTRVARNTLAATLEARARDPIKQTRKDAEGVRDSLKGAIAVPGAVYTVGKELATTGKSKSGAKIVRDLGKNYNYRLGDSYRGEPGAYKRQLERQRREGSYAEILDIASVAVPAGEAATAAVKGVARAQKIAGKTGTRAQKAIDATSKRAPLRESPGHVEPQKPRRTVPGAAVTATTDAARKAVQARAKKKAASGGRKKLSPRRAAAEPGEVVAISERLAARRSRKRVAKTTREERQVASARVQRELTSRKGGKDAPHERTTRRNMQELPSGAHREAALYAHRYGIRSAAGATAILSRRVKQLEKERAHTPLTKGERDADELPQMQALLASPHLFDAPAVKRVADIEVRRASRMSGPETGLDPERHLLARYQAQADTLDIARHAKETPHEYTRRVAKELGVKAPTDAEVHALARERGISRQAAAVEADKMFRRAVVKAKGGSPAPHLARRTEAEPAEEFVARVQEAAAKHGLVEPGYLPSRSNTSDAVAVRTGIDGNAEPPAGTFAKRSGDVFRRGLERQDPELLVGKLAQTARLGTRLKAGAEILQREGRMFETRTKAEQWIKDSGADAEQVEIVAAPVVRKGDAPPSDPDRGAYTPTNAVYVMPKKVLKEWDRQHADPSGLERGAARSQSIQQAVLLGASPSWFTFQVLADTITLGAAGGLHKLISANKEYRKLSDEDRELVDVHIGGSPANDVLLDKAGDQLGRTAAVLATSPTYRTFVQGRRPLTALLRAEGARAAAFRRAAFAARAAKIDRDIVAARAPLARVQGALAKDSPGDLAKALANPKAAEAAAEHVNKIMGNFADYTAAERRALKSVVPFYGFLRYSLRTVFYTLPVDHPYVAVLLAQLGRLGADEARDLVGPDLPYGLSKFYNADGTKAVDLSRASPLLNALSASSTFGQLTTGLMPPIAVIVANQAAGKNIFTGRNYKVQGSASATEGNDLTPEDRARIVAREMLKWLAPVRAHDKAFYDMPQSDDSLPFSRRFTTSVDPDTANSIEDGALDRAKQGRWDRLVGELLPLITPQKPSQDAAAGANATAKKAERKALRTKRAAKRDAIVNDPVEALKFQQAQQEARVRESLPDTSYVNDLLEAAGLKP